MPPKLIEVKFPAKITPFVWLAMGMGAVLVAAAIIMFVTGQAWTSFPNVLLGAGIGVILTAFGGQATLTGKGYVIAGAAAVAIGLIGFLEYQRVQQDERDLERLEVRAKSYVLGSVFGVPDGFRPYMRLSKHVLGSYDARDRQYRFALFRNEVRIQSAAVEFEHEGEPATVWVPAKCLIEAFGRDNEIHWEVRMQTVENSEIIEIFDRWRNGVIGRYGERRLVASLPAPDSCDTPFREAARPARQSGNHGLSFLGDWIFPAVRAQPVEEVASGFTDEELQRSLKDLESPDRDVRRGARTALANVPVERLPQLLAALHNGFGTYRIKLGITVGLTEMLRQDKKLASSIEGQLTDEDLSLLLQLAGDEDRTVRIYATEFLYDLDSERVARMAIDQAASTSDANARYNWLFVSQGGYKLLTDSEKQSLQTDLESAGSVAGPETQQLLKSFQ